MALYGATQSTSRNYREIQWTRGSIGPAMPARCEGGASGLTIALANHGGCEVERHFAGNGGPSSGAFDGLPIPTARAIDAGHARFGFSAVKKRNQHQRLL